MSFVKHALLLSLLGSAYAQSSASASAAASAAGSGAAAGGSQQALTATTQVANSINSALPQSASAGPNGFTIPSLSALTSGAPSDATVALDSTYSGGAAATKVSGAPALPTGTPSPANYPALDVSPPTNSSEVQGWLAKIDMSKVPNYNVTDGTCAGTPGAITDGRCWWTCGGCTRETDITECPDKMTWGLSYDDGPSPYTPLLLDYLDEKNITSTFFLVGSRVISRPQMVQSEYMAGHQLSVHTWSHPYLTKLTNEQIVAELGWTKKVIYDVTGVTPNTFRPPYGDIDDRVRAIAAQMGLTPIIWSSIKANGTTTNFDTTDWNIPGGQATGESSLTKFETILDTYAPQLDTGFIVLEHDLYQQTVDLAVGYVLPMALASGKFQLKSIISCLGRPLSEAYIETSSNTTQTMITSANGGSTYFQASMGTATGAVVTATGTGTASGANGAASGSSASSSKSAAPRSFAPINYLPALVAFVAVASGMALVA
ncbi:Chitin deacetylase [Saitozyma sp. JCM 24511]|nr:Chitin deacetylase [Saitozyma sp. JCM 24511]